MSQADNRGLNNILDSGNTSELNSQNMMMEEGGGSGGYSGG
jgi:hypothetical protein